MAGNKYVSINTNGDLQEVASIQTSAGAGDAGKIVSLNNAGQIDSTMLPSSGATVMTASEAISAGAMINLWNNSGTVNVRNATNTGIATKADGFVLATIASGSTGTVIIGDGTNSSVSSLTLGSEYFLGTAGGVVTTPPTGTGSIVQKVGPARTATELDVHLSQPIIRA